MTKEQIQILIAMCAYMALMIVVGLIYAKRNKSASDYLLGGRKLGPWMTAMSAEASDMSGWLLMGLPGLAYLTGIGEVFWTAIGLAAGTYLNWLFVAKRLRKYTKVAGNAITLPDYFSNRFHEKRRILMSLSAVLILLFFVIYLGSGFAAMGKLFKALFGLDYTLMMMITRAGHYHLFGDGWFPCGLYHRFDPGLADVLCADYPRNHRVCIGGRRGRDYGELFKL